MSSVDMCAKILNKTIEIYSHVIHDIVLCPKIEADICWGPHNILDLQSLVDEVNVVLLIFIVCF